MDHVVGAQIRLQPRHHRIEVAGRIETAHAHFRTGQPRIRVSAPSRDVGQLKQRGVLGVGAVEKPAWTCQVRLVPDSEDDLDIRIICTCFCNHAVDEVLPRSVAVGHAVLARSGPRRRAGERGVQLQMIGARIAQPVEEIIIVPIARAVRLDTVPIDLDANVPRAQFAAFRREIRIQVVGMNAVAVVLRTDLTRRAQHEAGHQHGPKNPFHGR